ncbi:hypothetical protein E2C01_033301 [Portunus trituberculatus]|uniref:Uncharacterized protein n=1 Tax=Portunus trituberculatus TaxID=210409 RepID=A0A5B7F3U3_PORTR|nr:hypothetical protein [Portunus trituberculatus]
MLCFKKLKEEEETRNTIQERLSRLFQLRTLTSVCRRQMKLQVNKPRVRVTSVLCLQEEQIKATPVPRPLIQKVSATQAVVSRDRRSELLLGRRQ